MSAGARRWREPRGDGRWPVPEVGEALVRDDDVDPTREFQLKFAGTADAHIEQQALDVAEHLFVALPWVRRFFTQVGGERLTRIDEQPDGARA